MSPRPNPSFEWDPNKNRINREKHGVSFYFAQYAFADSDRVILEDLSHSTDSEKRFYCLGKVSEGILTVRFTYRENKIRIFGARFWRRGKRIYEKQYQV